MPHDGVLQPLGIFARTFPGSTPGVVLQQAQQSGYSAVQYNMLCSGLTALPTVVEPDAVTSIRVAMAGTGMTAAALSATYNMVHPDGAVRAAGQASLATLGAVASALDIPMLTLCTGSRNAEDQWAPHVDNGSPDAWRDLLRSMGAALEVADRCGLMLGIEPEPSNVVDGVAAARRLVTELGSPRVGIVLDAANLIGHGATHDAGERQDVISRAVDSLADRIILVHAKDRAHDGSFVAPGRGAIDFRGYFGALVAARVRVPVITHGLRAEEAPGAAVFLRARMDEAGYW